MPRRKRKTTHHFFSPPFNRGGGFLGMRNNARIGCISHRAEKTIFTINNSSSSSSFNVYSPCKHGSDGCPSWCQSPFSRLLRPAEVTLFYPQVKEDLLVEAGTPDTV